MELYVGGIGQGKLQYVLNKKKLEDAVVADGADCALEQLLQADVIDQFHCYLRRLLQARQDVERCLDSLLEQNGAVLIILDEVGCGIVPMDAFERQYRDVVGRVSCELARRATHVERIVCGIGQVLK